jgi:hypothetical protein
MTWIPLASPSWHLPASYLPRGTNLAEQPIHPPIHSSTHPLIHVPSVSIHLHPYPSMSILPIFCRLSHPREGPPPTSETPVLDYVVGQSTPWILIPTPRLPQPSFCASSIQLPALTERAVDKARHKGPKRSDPPPFLPPSASFTSLYYLPR